MKRLEVGKLYSCSEYFLLLFPDKDTADAAEGDALYAELTDIFASAAAPPRLRVAAAAYWTREFARKLGKPISYCNPETPLLVLSVKKQYIQVLAGDKRGWIINEDWLEIKDIR
jgi:hypothetical protein